MGTTAHVHPMLETYGDGLPLPAYNFSLDGSGGISLLIEYGGNVYELKGRHLCRYRLVKVAVGYDDEIVASGTTTNPLSQLQQWIPPDFDQPWPQDDHGAPYPYFLALEYETNIDNWVRSPMYHNSAR